MRTLTLLTMGLCLVVLSVAAAADEVYIPSKNPTNTHNNNYPFNPKYGDWRYQLIIPPAMLGRMPFTVTDIAFKPTAAGGLLCSIFEVRMSHTTSKVSSLFAVNLPNPTTVLSSTNFGWATSAGAWSPIGLTGTFNYDGKSGLTIEVRHRGGQLKGSYTGLAVGVNNPGGCYRIGRYGSGAYNATSGSVWLKDGLVCRITMMRASITASGTGKIGSALSYLLSAPSEAGQPYQVGTSLGAGPVQIGTHTLPLSIDELLKLSVGNLVPTMFVNYSGKLDTNGAGKATLNIPNIAALKGVRIYSGFLTLDFSQPLGIGIIAPNNSMVTIS
jgi:hypothetical protein